MLRDLSSSPSRADHRKKTPAPKQRTGSAQIILETSVLLQALPPALTEFQAQRQGVSMWHPGGNRTRGGQRHAPMSIGVNRTDGQSVSVTVRTSCCNLRVTTVPASYQRTPPSTKSAFRKARPNSHPPSNSLTNGSSGLPGGTKALSANGLQTEPPTLSLCWACAFMLPVSVPQAPGSWG